MEAVWSRKLAALAPLTAREVAELDTLMRSRSRHLAPRQDLVVEGDAVQSVALVRSGWVCRYKQLVDGRRQITGFFLPGDLCGSHLATGETSDMHVASVNEAEICEIPTALLQEIAQAYPAIGHALCRDLVLEGAIQRSWSVSLGRRDARERLAHLLCEVYVRLGTVGLVTDDGFHCPVRQVDFADALGITPVHVNRTLQDLRAAGLIHKRSRFFSVPDFPRLMAAGLFHPGYLSKPPPGGPGASGQARSSLAAAA